MGENRRFGSSLTAAAVNEFLVRPRAISLTPDELGDDPVTAVVDGDEVDVWVRFPETPVRERGRVVAYTDRAVRVEVPRRDGSSYPVWVWQGAVSAPELRDRR